MGFNDVQSKSDTIKYNGEIKSIPKDIKPKKFYGEMMYRLEDPILERVEQIQNSEGADNLRKLAVGKDENGNPTISANDFKQFCHDNYPNANLTNVDKMTNYICIEDAINSIGSYYAQQQTYDLHTQAEALGEKPKMGDLSDK